MVLHAFQSATERARAAETGGSDGRESTDLRAIVMVAEVGAEAANQARRRGCKGAQQRANVAARSGSQVRIEPAHSLTRTIGRLSEKH